MRVVAALGGNALLRRGEPLTAARQGANVALAARALADLVASFPGPEGIELVITHGNGPQIGLLALQVAAHGDPEDWPLDVLGAETSGMIGYALEQALGPVLPDRRIATLLTRVLVDPADPAFAAPVKPVGPVYAREEAEAMAQARGWTIGADGQGWRRQVASPRPVEVPGLSVIRTLLDAGIVVICGGGGGIPVVRDPDGTLSGIEAVIDKDWTAAFLAEALEAEALLLLTDVEGVHLDWGGERPQPLARLSPEGAAGLSLDPGSMGPKVEAGLAFARATGKLAAIGRLEDAAAILAGNAGTRLLAPSQNPRISDARAGRTRGQGRAREEASHRRQGPGSPGRG